MAALLGNLSYAGQQTILATQSALGAVNQTAALYSIASGQVAAAPPDIALFQMGLSSGPVGIATQGVGAATLPVLLFTRTGSTTVWYNPNTTAVQGDICVQYIHSICR